MIRWPRWAASALICLGLAAQAQTTPQVVTFEDISPNDLADGYGGLSGWAGIGGSGMGDHDLGGNGQKAFFGHAGVLSFIDGPVHVFGTLYKSYAANPDEPPFAAMELWYQGRAVASILDPRAPLGMLWLSTNYAGPVDAIRFQGGLEGFSIDDLTYERLDVSNVPEPASWLLLPMGLAALGLRRRFSAGAPGSCDA